MNKIDGKRELDDLKVAYSSTRYLIENSSSLFYNNEVLKGYCVNYLDRIRFLENLLNSSVEEGCSGKM